MEIFDVLAFLMVLAGAISYINYRYFRLPSTVGFMLAALIFSLVLVALGRTSWGQGSQVHEILGSMNFSQTVLYGMLSFLLFAGTQQVKLSELRTEILPSLLMASLGVVISTLVVGFLMFYISPFFGANIPLLFCLLFGALISPTDPVTVLSMMKVLRVPRRLRLQIIGESLFNDGFALAVVLVISGLITEGQNPSVVGVIKILVLQVGLSVVMGYLLAKLGYYLLKDVAEHNVQLFLTLGLVSGGYYLAILLHSSGPITVVLMGLLLRKWIDDHFASTSRYRRLFLTWEVIDEFLNALLFTMVGLALFLVQLTAAKFMLSLTAVFVVLFGRLVSVWIPQCIVNLWRKPKQKHALKLTWLGLRGGLSLAIVLGLEQDALGSYLTHWTYTVVVFSIVVQGLSISSIFPSSTPQPMVSDSK